MVADDHGPEYVPSNAGVEKASPVQYCGFGEPTTLLQTALHRARRIAAAAQIAVTVREENRARWESALWCLRPDRHFVSDTRLTSSLTTAAALLSIAADSAKNVVTILPARCYVANEWLLASALDRLHRILPAIPEGVGTLGMVDIDDAVDEDYLVPREGESGGSLRLGRNPIACGYVSRPAEKSSALAEVVASYISAASASSLWLRLEGFARGTSRLPSQRVVCSYYRFASAICAAI